MCSSYLLQYWESIKQVPLVYQVLLCSGEFLEYIGIGACILIVLHFTVKIPRYIFRKLLHLVAFTSVIEMVLIAENWFAASMTALLFAALVYPVLTWIEGCSWFDNLFVQKKEGEVKKSLLLLFCSMAVLIFVTWGIVGEQYIAVTTILMWGCGDAAAALIGIPFGRHTIKWKRTDGKKSWEGTIAMTVTAFVVGGANMILTSGLPWYTCLVLVAIAAPIAALVELVSKEGIDTVSVPASVAALFVLLSLL